MDKVDKIIQNTGKLFTVGPVNMDKELLKISNNQIPYFRTDEFSEINLEIENKFKQFAFTKKTSKLISLTSSGTGAMEAAIINVFDKNDKLLIINGGSFGQRFIDICTVHKIPHTEIKLKAFESFDSNLLKKYKNKNYTGLLINALETSTGVLYDLEPIGNFCKENNIIFMVDAISSFLSDKFYMDKWHIDITIFSTQKALACPPGLSFIIINDKIKDLIENKKDTVSFYFNLKNYLKNSKRGQTPFTPAVGIILQVYKQLSIIEKQGLANYLKKTETIATDFRSKLKELDFSIPSKSLSNTLTPISPKNNKIKASDIYLELKNKYCIFVNPNGGDLKDEVLRIGHIGVLSTKDNEILIEKLKKIQEL